MATGQDLIELDGTLRLNTTKHYERHETGHCDGTGHDSIPHGKATGPGLDRAELHLATKLDIRNTEQCD